MQVESNSGGWKKVLVDESTKFRWQAEEVSSGRHSEARPYPVTSNVLNSTKFDSVKKYGGKELM